MEIGLGKKQPEDAAKIIESGDRRNAGHTAPAEGLYLVEIYYEEEELKKKEKTKEKRNEKTELG